MAEAPTATPRKCKGCGLVLGGYQFVGRASTEIGLCCMCLAERLRGTYWNYKNTPDFGDNTRGRPRKHK